MYHCRSPICSFLLVCAQCRARVLWPCTDLPSPVQLQQRKKISVPSDPNHILRLLRGGVYPRTAGAPGHP
uniref:Putative secreted protein n=1 Tax=Ixodes ricinus TaxID=34613 RepID=A0A6B0TRU2_IXORI